MVLLDYYVLRNALNMLINIYFSRALFVGKMFPLKL